ncbi:MAG: carboxypeptidase-like regulatory domain-containing protein [Ignavibacteriaceae bacterium]|nr:carboxypeptidase-like regulatory domain-containing protein [Ignavibacteriaceae bacterium]
MRYRFLLITVIVSIVLSLPVLAVSLFEKGIIKGTIIDSSSGSPVSFANIILYRQKDSSFAGGTSTGTTGEFILNNVTEGNYYLKVNLLGYSNKYISGIKVVKDKPQIDAGMISLSKSVLEIKGVQITGEKPSEELKLDKKVINVS